MLSHPAALPFSLLFADSSLLPLYYIEACSVIQVHQALALISGTFSCAGFHATG